MSRKKVGNLSKDSLYQMGDVLHAQHLQLDSLEKERDDIQKGINIIQKNNIESSQLLDEADTLVDALLKDKAVYNQINADVDDVEEIPKINIKKTEIIRTNNNWNDYLDEYKVFAKTHAINTEFDPFMISLSQREYKKMKDEIDGEFAKRTSIKNKIDLSFLAIAIALQTAKSLLFPLAAQQVGYAEAFDKDMRRAHNDKSIKTEERSAKDFFRDKKYTKENETGEWIEILYRKPIYDTAKGSPEIGINMEGGYHRIHTLGHDPILGWIFGTSNILTDTITFDTFVTYQGARDPIRITSEKVPFIILGDRTIKSIKSDPLNLPAAIMAEKIHLKSDEFTKAGLPIPIIETFAPTLAGKLYKQQYDALCLSRDLKVIGTSAAISMLIDIIIGLVHAMYYDSNRDGAKDLFEVRTKKILLISNAIASSSNIIYSIFTHNPKHLDIGGLLVTLSHLVCDARFIINVKKEFIENKIYEKIDEELNAIEENGDKLFGYEYGKLQGIQLL